VLKVTPSEVVTDAAAVYPGVLDELIPSAWHHVEQYANNPIEADHSQLYTPAGHDCATEVRSRNDATWPGVMPGWADSASAATPVMCGPDIDDPAHGLRR
jgi:hypothetical protein